MKTEMIVSRCLGFALCFMAQCASAQLAVKEFVLGADLIESTSKLGMTCSTREGGKVCSNAKSNKPDSLKTVAGVPVTRVIVAGDGTDKIGEILYTFSQSDFSSVRSAFSERFPSLKCADTVVQNRMGAKFDQTECLYKGEGGRVELSRRGDGGLNEGQLTVTSDAYLAWMSVLVEKKKTNAKGDI